MTTQLTTTNNITLERRDSYSAWLSGFRAYQRGGSADLLKVLNADWQAGYYDAQAAAELAELVDGMEFENFVISHMRGI